jgi:ABC-2 type transport system ATP-binding protein
MLMNLLQPSSGRATLLGLDCREDHTALMQRVGYVAESPIFYDWMKVREIVSFTAQFYTNWNQGSVELLLNRFGINPEQKIRYLSRGMYAQLALALAMGNDPQLLILDEPATGLDVMVRRDFLESIIQLIQQQGKTVLFSSHLVHEVERVADQIVMIDGGRLLTCSAVDDLKQGIRRFVVRSSPTTDLMDVPGVLRSSSDGGDTVLTVQDLDGKTRHVIEDRGHEVVEVTGLSLEEIFVEMVSAAALGSAA